MNTAIKIQNVTSRGQITLPAYWRNKNKSDYISIVDKGGSLEIRPFKVQQNTEYTVFDAIRDNNGKGVSAKDLISILKKLDNE